jgi:hypothetical protein
LTEKDTLSTAVNESYCLLTFFNSIIQWSLIKSKKYSRSPNGLIYRNYDYAELLAHHYHRNKDNMGWRRSFLVRCRSVAIEHHG